QTLIAIGVLAVIAVIVGYAVYMFLNMTEEAPGGPENAGALGSEHSHAAILVKIFGDTFEFSGPAFQIKSPWIHFESRDGSTIHKHATGVDLGYLFGTLSIGLDDQCYVFPDGKQFCTNEDYTLKFFINGEQMSDIRDYEIMEDDRILIVFGAETPEEIEAYLLQLDNQELVK
ncbi:MAG: protein-disulfide isomerase, partial [Nitrosopumilus sp.]|nr:protein-disulfide isomerase [Nitrosopumilus sp.]